MEFIPSLSDTPNDFFIIIYVTQETFDTQSYFMTACSKLTDTVSVCDFKKIHLEKTNEFMCKELGEGYINSHVKHADYFICLMNKSNSSLAGFLYGNIFINKDFVIYGLRQVINPWVLLNIDVLCGHELLKGVGFVLILFVKCLTCYIVETIKENELQRLKEGLPPINKTGFVLESVPDVNTQKFYERNEIKQLSGRPFNFVLHPRYWNVPDDIDKISELIHSLNHSKIKLKKSSTEKQDMLHLIEILSPRSARTFLLEGAIELKETEKVDGSAKTSELELDPAIEETKKGEAPGGGSKKKNKRNKTKKYKTKKYKTKKYKTKKYTTKKYKTKNKK